jgi:transposase
VDALALRVVLTHRLTRVILGVPSRPGLKVLVAAKPVDFRQGMNSLAGTVTQTLAAEPFACDVFIFHSRRAGRLKSLTWDGVRTNKRRRGSIRYSDPN